MSIGLFAAVPITAVILSVARAAITILQPEGEQDLPSLVPGWLDRVAQFSWRVVVLVAVGALGVFIVVALPIVVIPIVGGLILAATLDPLVIPLVKRGWSRTQVVTRGCWRKHHRHQPDADLCGHIAHRWGTGNRGHRQDKVATRPTMPLAACLVCPTISYREA